MTGRPHAQPPRIDAVVVAYNSGPHLRRCLEALVGCEAVFAFVVDNASSDGSLATIADLPVTVLAQHENLGFARGCNVGWRAGLAEFVLFVNPDAELDCNSVAALALVLSSDHTIGVVGPRLQDGDGDLWFSQRRFPRLRSTFSQALFLHRVFADRSWSDEVVRHGPLYDAARDVEWLSGACMLVRRELLERIGGFDESFFLYSEDTELCRASWASGFRVRYEPAAVARHAGGASAPRSALLAVLARSRIAYARKNYAPAVALGHRTGIALEALTHMIVCRGGLAQRYGHVLALVSAFGRGADGDHGGIEPAARA